MPLDSFFIEPPSNPAPDLSLHISPPNNSSSSICSSVSNKVDTGFDHFRGELQAAPNKPNGFSSMTGIDSQAYTELSLAYPAYAFHQERLTKRSFMGGSQSGTEDPADNTFQRGATPKSVLELMDVKDLTLAHVKSHLQMYRTVKSTDKPAASSGQSDGSGDEDICPMESSNEPGLQRFADPRDGSIVQQELDYPYSATLWSNSSSSREAWEQADANGHRQATFHPQQESRHLIEECNATRLKSYLGSSLDSKNPNPNLEFTLGRPDWQAKHYN